MSDILIILQLVLFICVIILFYLKFSTMNKQIVELNDQIDTQNKRNQGFVVEETERNFVELKSKLEEVVENDRAQLYQLYKAELANIEGTKKDHIIMIDQFLQKVEQDFEEVKAALAAHVNLRDAEHDLWIEKISQAKDEPQKVVEMVESAISQFPYSRSLFEVYLELLNPYKVDPDQRIRKGTVEKLNRASRIFLDHCSVHDWDFAIRTHNEILKYGNEIMVESYQKRKEEMIEALSHLENSIDQLEMSNGSETNLIERIEVLENKIDKALIEREPQLLSTYKRLSKRLIDYYSKDQQVNEMDIRDYNLQAVRKIGEAYDHFVQDEKTYRAGGSLSYLVTRLSGWNTQYLKEETQIYFQAIYSEIFGKLNPDVKPIFTKAMLNSNKKVV